MMPVAHELGVGARWSALRDARVIVTRPAERASGLIALLSTAGATPVHCPTASYARSASSDDLDRELLRCASFDWILWTSVNAVDAVVRRAEEMRAGDTLRHGKHAALAASTARALRDAGLESRFVATGGSAVAFAMELPVTAGMSALFPRSSIARRDLPDGLTSRGVHVAEVVAYTTVPGSSPAAILDLAVAMPADFVTFCSPSAARGFIDAWESAETPVARGRRPIVVCLGDASAHAARACGWTPAAVAAMPTMEDLLDAMTRVAAA